MTGSPSARRLAYTGYGKDYTSLAVRPTGDRRSCLTTDQVRFCPFRYETQTDHLYWSVAADTAERPAGSMAPVISRPCAARINHR